MPVSAWIMLGFGCLVLYGGLGFCLLLAWRKGRERAAREGGGPAPGDAG